MDGPAARAGAIELATIGRVRRGDAGRDRRPAGFAGARPANRRDLGRATTGAAGGPEYAGGGAGAPALCATNAWTGPLDRLRRRAGAHFANAATQRLMASDPIRLVLASSSPRRIE